MSTGDTLLLRPGFNNFSAYDACPCHWTKLRDYKGDTHTAKATVGFAKLLFYEIHISRVTSIIDNTAQILIYV